MALETDFVVIGSGVAGLRAAIALASSGALAAEVVRNAERIGLSIRRANPDRSYNSAAAGP